MGKGYLVDSNAVIGLFNGTMSDGAVDFLNEIEIRISIITQIEIFGYSHISPMEYQEFESFIDNSIVYDVDPFVAKETIKLRSSNKIKLPDAIIAATAICFDLTLVTRNITDFKKIVGLKVLDPYSL